MLCQFFTHTPKKKTKVIDVLISQKNEIRDIRHSLQRIVDKNSEMMKIQNEKKSDYIYLSNLYSIQSTTDHYKSSYNHQSQIRNSTVSDDIPGMYTMHLTNSRNIVNSEHSMTDDSIFNDSNIDKKNLNKNDMKQFIRDENTCIKNSIDNVSNDIKRISLDRKLIDVTFALLLSINLELNQQLKTLLKDNQDLLEKVKKLENDIDYQRSEYIKIFN